MEAGLWGQEASALRLCQLAVDDMPSENGLQARRKLFHRFGPASAQAQSNLRTNLLKPPKCEAESKILLVDNIEDML